MKKGNPALEKLRASDHRGSTKLRGGRSTPKEKLRLVGGTRAEREDGGRKHYIGKKGKQLQLKQSKQTLRKMKGERVRHTWTVAGKRHS